MSERIYNKPLPDIWAENSPEVKIIAQKYERAGWASDWDNNRVSELARALNKTIWVLCAEAGAFTQEYSERQDRTRLVLDRKGILKAWKQNLWPVSWVMNFQRLSNALGLHHNRGEMLTAVDITACRLISGRL